MVQARITGDDVRCGRRGCEGRFGRLVGDRLNPGPGWEYEGGEPQPDEFSDYALVGGTWRPTKRARDEWRKAYAQVSRGWADDKLKNAVRAGLTAFARPEPRPGFDAEGEPIFADGRQIGNAAKLPLRVECYVCVAVNNLMR